MTETSPGSLLPYGRQLLHDDDLAAVTAVLRGDYWTTGPAVAAFEDAFSRDCGAVHAVAVANGTAALHVAAAALGLGPGSLAIAPDITFAATANAARFVGADLLLCDVDPDTGLMTPDTLAAAISSTSRRVDCVLPVHLAGQTVDLEGLRKVCAASPNSRDVVFIEDGCHAIGTDYPDGGRVGNSSRSAMTTFSFHPVKTIAAGEGGMVTTNDDQLAHRLRLLRSHGITRKPEEFACVDQAFAENGTPNAWYYEVTELGFNFRLSDIHSALGLSQLGRLEDAKQTRADLAAQYDRLLAPLAPSLVPLGRIAGCDPCWHLYVVLIDFASLGLERQLLVEALYKDCIGTQVHYIPLHRQPSFAPGAPQAAILPPHLEGAERYYARCLSLPLFVGMSEFDTQRVAESLTRIINCRCREMV